MTAVEVGSLVTAWLPREGWGACRSRSPCAAALKLSSAQMSGQRHAISFEPLAVELKAVQQSQSHAVMVVEGANQAARLRRHLEAYDLDINLDCKSFPELLDREDFRPAIIEGEISAGVVLEADGIYVYSEEEIFGEPRAHRKTKPRAEGHGALNLEELRARRSRRASRSWDRAVSRTPGI